MKRVLIVDDALIAQVILQRILTTAGYEVAGIVSDGNVASEAFRTTHPDVVLLDVGIPGKDGLQVLREIRALSTTTPVIMCSALRLDTKVEEAMHLGASAYIMKPIDKAEVLSTIQDACSGAAA